MPRNTSVTLGEHFDKFVVEKINEGRFQSVSEVVRAGLRKLEEDEAKLEKKAQAAAKKGGGKVGKLQRVTAQLKELEKEMKELW